MNGAPDHFEAWMLEEVEKINKAAAKKAPEFELTDLAGERARLADQRGKVVVLTFWDSWSRECQLELPQLNMLTNSFKDDQSVVFWAISVEAPVSVTAFIKKNPFTFRLFPSGLDVKKMYEIIGYPTHIIIDKNGSIRYTQIGFSGDIHNKLQQEIQRLSDENEVAS
jgi:peroxiredoxin